MMKKYGMTLFAFLLIIVKSSFAQTYKISNETVLQYNKLINAAELLICDSLFSDALSIYETAFKLTNEPFAIDQYNAAMCALNTGDYNNVESLLVNVVRKGYDYKLLDNNKTVNLLDAKHHADLLRKLKHVSVEINYKLKDIYDSLLISDQYFRKDSLYWIKNRDTLCKTDYTNGKFLNTLIDMYGFPSEKTVGVSNNLLMALPWEIIVIHNHVNPSCNNRVDFSMVIWEALEQGLIRIPKAANYLEQSIGVNIFGTDIIGLVKAEYKSNDTCYYKCGFFNLPDKSIDRINSQRISIGLGTIVEARKKVLFNISNPDFIFSEREKFTYSYANLLDYNYFIDNLSEVR